MGRVTVFHQEAGSVWRRHYGAGVLCQVVSRAPGKKLPSDEHFTRWTALIEPGPVW